MSEKSSRREFLDTVLSVSAAVVALSALGVSIYQAKLARDQQRASAWPRLDLTNNNGPHLYGRVIRNVGLGPAIVRSMTITANGRALRTWSEVGIAIYGPDARRMIANDTALQTAFSSVHRGSVLLPGASIEQIRLSGSALADTFENAAMSGRLLWTTCYCSLYGDCWTTTSQGEEPTPARSCPERADTTREFRN